MLPAQAVELFEALSSQCGSSKILAKVTSKYWITTCPSPKHVDHKPSCFVSPNHPHGFKCRSCGYSGTLYAIAKDLGIEVDTKLVITGPNRKVFIPPDLNKLRLAPWTGDYRGISEAQWLSLGAMKWYDTYIDQETQEEKLSAERILLPIYQNGMLVSYTGRRLDDSKMAKYKNYEFAPAGEILYMHNCIQPTWPVVLVEGPLDAIKYQLNQIPAVGLMGSQNWSDYKLKLLLSTCPSTVWLSMDGDAAGQTAQKEYFNLLKKYVDVQVINIPNGVDPFELEQSLIEDIKNGIWARFYEKVPQHA